MSAALDGICAALGLQATPAQTAALLQYLELLQRWNTTYNLTAVRDPGEMLTQHLADCLALIPPLQRHQAQGRLLDVGSGGGSARCGDRRDAARDRRDLRRHRRQEGRLRPPGRCDAALAQPARRARPGRTDAASAFDVVTSRAFASLADFTRWTRARLAPGGVWLAMKGKHPDDEIAALPADVDVFHVEPLAVPGLDAQRCLVWMRPAASAAPAAPEPPAN